MDAKSGNGGNRGGCPTMAASLLLLGLAVTAGAETRTLPQSWMTVASNPLATASVERILYERADDPHFYIRVRITNTTDRPLGADLRDYWRVIYPNQWGVSQASQRGEINERRLKQVADKSALVPDFAAGKLTRLEPGATLDYYREFNAGGRKEVEEQARQFAGKYLVVSLDGQVPVTDGKRIEALSCVWEGDRTAADTDLVIPLPVKWSKVSEAALVVSAVAAAEADAPWGAAVEGVQVRLRAEKTVWAAGEVPELKVDARNNGDRKLVAPHGSLLFDVEVYGRWYSWSGPVSVQSTEFSAAKPREGIVVSLGLRWQPKDGNYTLSQLPLTPGKHIIRVAFQASPSGAELQKRELPDLRAISNPVEIEVQDPKTGRAAPNPAPLAHAAVIKELAAKSDQIVLGQILKVHDYTARDGGMGYEVRVTKVIKGATTELPLRFRSAGWTGYARYAVDESVLLFLQSKQPAPNVPGEWGQLAPVVYLAKDPRPGGVSLWPVADYLPLLAEPRPAVPTTTGGKVELPPKAPWGAAVEGVQVRLRAEKDVWEVGEVELLADARCVGSNQYNATASHRGWEIAVDGTWYVWGEPVNEPPGVFDIHHPRTQVRLPLNQSWVTKDAKQTPLILGTGTHDIDAAFVVYPSNLAGKKPVPPVRAVSRFARVHVQKPLAKGEVPVYAQVIVSGDEREPAKYNLEPWIARELTARGEKQFRAATPWIRLTDEWTGLDTGIGCPGGGQIVARKSGGDVIVEITGFTPEGRRVKLTVPDKIGACTIGVVDPGQNYVALRTGPPARVAQLQTQEDQTTAALKSHGFHYVVLSDEQKATLDAALGLLTLEKQTKAQSRLIDAAAVYLSEQINFAAGVERACTEYRGYFWFSRLDTAGQGDQTFASGFAIRKGTGDIYRWKNAKPRAPATDPDPKASKGNAAWSEVNDGLRGRLMIAQPKIAADGWLQATLELENVGKTPLIVFTGNPMLFKASVVDVAGKPVLPTNGRDVLMSPQRVVIEAGKRLSIPVTIVSLDGAKGSQVDTTTRIWKLPPGQYTLGGTYGWDAIEEMPPRGTWLGQLMLPSVSFEIVAAGAAPPAARVLEPFYRNGWHGWPVGTEVRTTFLDDKVEGWYSYVQPDLVYRLTETALTRTQVVDGKPVVQQFDPANETGWQPSYLHKLQTAKTTPITIEIDGVKIDCLLYESTMDHIGRDVGGTTVLKEWVLAAHPSTWLRTEANKNYKVIKSLRAMRQVGDRQVACVVVEERMELSGGHQISTTWLSPEVPGHVVEKISETWFEGRQHRTHERLAEARIPVPTSAVALIQALADSDNDHRAKAAAELRRLLAENPSAAPNRHDKTFWEQRLAQIQPGISQEEAIKRLLPDATTGEREQSIMGGPWSGQSGSVICRLDDYWTATIFVTDFENPKVMHAPALNAHVRSVWVKPPDNFTGRWTTYYVNGQKANEIEYRAGKYEGTFTAFNDDGSKSYEQHYTAGVCHGTDTGWHRNGQKAYEGIYEHGKQIGTWRWWDEAGKVTSEKTFTEPTP